LRVTHIRRWKIEPSITKGRYSLSWARLDNRKSSRISRQVTTGGYLNEEAWPAIHEELIDAMTRLEKALAPHIARLK